MKFQIKNEFAPNITEIDISEKELFYIGMLMSGVKLSQALELLSMSISDLHIFYNKLGLSNSKRIKHMQAITLFVMNNIVSDNNLLDIYKKYNLIECKEMAEFMSNKNKEGRKDVKRKFKRIK